MLRSRTRARDRRGRSAGALLCASLSLAAALALAAPLVHAHLAAADTTRDLCGEHHSERSNAEPVGDACSLCLAGAHAPALREAGAARLAGPATPARIPAPAREDARSVARSRPDAPRAPPLSA